MSDATVDSQPGYSLKRGWRTLALAGGVVALIGILAIALPFAAGISVTLGLGALLVVAAVVHAAHAVTARGWRGSLWQLVLAVVSVIAGIFLLVNPIVGLVTLTILLVAYLVVDGIAELYMAMRMADQPGRGSVAFSGAISLVLAALLWTAFPADTPWVIGLLVGISLFMTGLSMAVVAYEGRKIDDASATVSEPRGA
ncbi:HdeD family acid-resistance protein [Halosolutus gelatinilyticus]|uniref:HdeD family acid-resistance protein n=1 Tax=Halosolutus gelatinilyticus TaxID=2931975 RepID=UPI001FF351B3|nr:DUF308 domain-containing protein [Halosolutus gelatinilyticus]